MSIEPAASRCITLNGNQYLYLQYATTQKNAQSKLLKYNRETSAYEPVSRKFIYYFADGYKQYVREYFPMRDPIPFPSKYNSVMLSPDGKYRHIGGYEPGVYLSLERIDSNKLKLTDFSSVKGSLSEFSPFARKWISKILKGTADGTVIADNFGELLKKVKIFR